MLRWLKDHTASQPLSVGVSMVHPFLIRQIYKICREDPQNGGRERSEAVGICGCIKIVHLELLGNEEHVLQLLFDKDCSAKKEVWNKYTHLRVVAVLVSQFLLCAYLSLHLLNLSVVHLTPRELQAMEALQNGQTTSEGGIEGQSAVAASHAMIEKILSEEPRWQGECQ